MPQDQTFVGFEFMYGAFHRVVRGSESSESSAVSVNGRADRLEAALNLRHYYGDGFSTSLRIPAGTVRLDPNNGAASEQRSGFGDWQVEARYDLAALWAPTEFRRSLEISTGLALPTGKQETIGSLDPSFPPQIVGLGRSVFSFILGAEYAHFLNTSLGLKANASMALPLTETSQGIIFGPAYSYGLGAVFVQEGGMIYSGQLAGFVQMPSEKSGAGEITNSGNHVLAIQALVSRRVSDRFSLGAQLNVPVMIQTQGTQVAESFTITGVAVVHFGGADNSKQNLQERAAIQEETKDDFSEEVSEDEQAEIESTEVEALRNEIALLREAQAPPPPAPPLKPESLQSIELNRLQAEIEKLKKQSEPHAPQVQKAEVATPIPPEANASKPRPRPRRRRFSVSTPVSDTPSKPAPGASPSIIGKRKAGLSGDVLDLARGGRSFAIKNALVPNKITVIDFWADWCRPCKKIGRLLDKLAAADDRLAIRKVEVPNLETPVARQHLRNISGLPVVWIYDERGQRIETLNGTSPAKVRSIVLGLLADQK